jgi:hypothetical protein
MFQKLFTIFIAINMQSALAGLTQTEFNHAIDKVISTYKPELDRKGITLNLNRYFNNHTDSSDTYVDSEDMNKWHINMRRAMSNYNGANKEMVMFVVCHELGHHLGGAPKHINHNLSASHGNQWASVEGQADYWAVNKCLRKVFVKDNNQKIVRDLNIPSVGKTKCRAAWKHNRVQQALCERVFHLAENSFFAKVKYASVFQEDNSKVAETYGSHPEAQCRIDTMKAAAICTSSVNDPVSNIFLDQGACVSGEGKRPACWFKNIKSTVDSDSHTNNKLKSHIDADELEVVAKLISSRKMTVNRTLDNGMSILMYAILKKSRRISEFLIAHQDIDVNWQNEKGQGAIHVMSSKGIPYQMGLLLKRNDVDVNLADSRGITALMAVAYSGYYRMYHLLIGDARVQVAKQDKKKRDVSFYIQNGKANFKNEFLQLYRDRL